MARNTWTDEQLIALVPTSYSVADILRGLGLAPAGGNYSTIKRKLKELDLDTSHFKGQRWNAGRKFAPKRTLESILKKNSPYSSWALKIRLIAEGVFEAKCYKCLRVEWNGLPIPTELEHINGDHDDNRLENLTILCNNCHAQTPTYRGRNMRTKFKPD